MLLRDAGPLEILEQGYGGREEWVLRQCAIDKVRGSLDVLDRTSSSRKELLFSIPLGDPTLIVSGCTVDSARDASGGGRCFKVVFDDRSKVVSFRAKDSQDADGWAASLQVFGKSTLQKDFVGFGTWLDHIEKNDSAALALSSEETTQEKQGEYEQQLERQRLERLEQLEQQRMLEYEQHDEDYDDTASVSREESASLDIVRGQVAQHSEVKRCCGYFFVLSPTVSPKWRETFCVFIRQHLLEFAFPGDASPLFIWSLSKSNEPKLVRANTDTNTDENAAQRRLQILINGKLHRLEDDTNTVNLDCGSSDLSMSIQICAASDNDTRALSLSLPNLLRPLAPSSKVWNQSKLNFSVPSLSRQCAHFVLQPFHPQSELSAQRASDYAVALSIAARGALLRNARIRASSQAHEFPIFYFLSGLGEDLADLAQHLSIELELSVPLHQSRDHDRHDLTQLGLQRLVHGRISRLEDDVVANSHLLDLQINSSAPASPSSSSIPPQTPATRNQIDLLKKQDWPNQALVGSIELHHTGNFRLAVKYKKFHVFGSPFRVQVVPGQVSPRHCSIDPVMERSPGSDEYIFKIARRDAFFNKCSATKRWKDSFNVTIESSEDESALVGVTNSDRQVATVCIKTTNLRSTLVSITLNEQHIRGSPFCPHLLFSATTTTTTMTSASSLIQKETHDEVVSEVIRTAAIGKSVLFSSFGAVGDQPKFSSRHLAHSSQLNYPDSMQHEWARVPQHAPQTTPLSPVHLPITASTIATKYVSQPLVNRIMDQVAELDALLSPLIEVAIIECRHKRPTADWKYHLAHWDSVQADTSNYSPTTAWLQDRLAALKNLETVFSRAHLPRRQELCENIRQVMHAIAALLRDIRFQQLNSCQ